MFISPVTEPLGFIQSCAVEQFEFRQVKYLNKVVKSLPENPGKAQQSQINNNKQKQERLED